MADALGAGFGELGKIVLDAIQRCVNFNQTLTQLSTTLKRLGPKIQEIQELSNELGRPKEELEPLFRIMREGTQLVRDCSKISKYDIVGKTRYEGKLQQLIKSLERFITIDLQVQNARDHKQVLHLVRKVLACVKPEEDATAASSSDSISTPLLEDVSESEIYGSTTGTWTNSSPQQTIEQEEQLELLLPGSVNSSSFTNPSAPNDSMTSLEKSSTIGIDANVVTHKNKKVFVRGFLSITVISAENLPALGFMRKSDPFVVLTLRKAKSKAETKYKTKVVNQNLNPNWNQKFVFEVEDGLHDMVIIEVWDKGTIRKDFIGRCALSIKTVIVKEEYEERFIIGPESSYLNLHLKWTHQPICYDSNSRLQLSICDLELKPVGILKVKLLQAKELTKKHIIRKSDPFAVLYITGSGDKKEKSETINNDLNPIWNEKFEFIVKDESSTQHLSVLVYDSKHSRSSNMIGRAQIRLSELQPGKVKYVWLKLVNQRRDNKNRGQVHAELLYCPFGMENSFTNPFAPNFSGVLSVTVISAEDLPALDFMRKSDPFVVLTLRKAKSKEEIRNKTRVVSQDLNPVWDQTFSFVVDDGLHDMVIVEVWDKDPFGKDYMGRCILSLTKVILEGEYTESFELVGAKSGSLKLRLKWKA